MTPMTPMRSAQAPTRACLSGEDLDWLGYRSVCVALDLPTTVRTGGGRVEDDDFLPLAGGHAAMFRSAWQYLLETLRACPRPAPDVRARWTGPIAGGLSSSTSLTVALFRLFLAHLGQGRNVGPATLARWALEVELPFDGGGGMDHLAIVHGGSVLTRGRDGELPELIASVPFPRFWTVLVVDSGVTKSTLAHTNSVREQVAAEDPRLARYIQICDDASARVWSGLTRQFLPDVWSGMRTAHGAMRDIQGMSTPFLEKLRRSAEHVAGIPFKVSGSGGGGALVAVCRRDDRELVERLRRELADRFPSTRLLSVDGVDP